MERHKRAQLLLRRLAGDVASLNRGDYWVCGQEVVAPGVARIPVATMVAGTQAWAPVAPQCGGCGYDMCRVSGGALMDAAVGDHAAV